ncbi:MAG: hypothetical protein DCF16_15895 [Alphaproteobacteria bacterium]|nr:MAG: hypothetical protein DCF16_15895 [Alphaproteobacteria bacterium]
MSRGRVVIIGGGFSGVAVAAQLMKRGRAAPDVVLIGREQRFGPGLAYGTRDPAHLLNVRASNMSAFADQPDHFVRWLAAHGRRDAAQHFAKRAQYGAYAEHVLRRAHGGLGGASLTRVRDTAIACRTDGALWTVTLARGKPEADAVVLALGNAPPRPPAVFEQGGVTLLAPWDTQALARIPRGDVLLLGAGLTMIDVALSLARRRKRGVIFALSRRGQIPRAHLRNAAPATPAALDVPAPLSEALHQFRAEVKAMAARGEPWQHALDRLRSRAPELWRRLPLAAQQRFLRHLRVWWDVHRHRAAPEIAEQIKALQAAGRLKVLAGEIVSAAPNEHGVRLQHRGRGSRARHNMDVAAVVNCTGSSADPWLSEDGLVRQMLDEGLLRAHATKLGFDISDDSRVLAASGTPHQSLFAVGPITQGAFWESTAVPEIRVRAAAIAAMLAPDA